MRASGVSGRDHARRLAASAFWHAHPGRPERAHSLLRASQWWSLEELRALQVEAVRRLLRAAVVVPLYRERLREAGLAPEDVRSLDDLAAIRPLTREELQDAGVRGLRTPGGRGARIATSGSTGQPVRLIRSLEMRAWMEATDLRAREWSGYRWGDHRLLVAHTSPSWRPSLLTVRTRVHCAGLALSNVTVFCTDRLAEPDGVRRLVRRLERRPAVLVGGISNGLYALALALLAAGRRLPARACLTSGNTLPRHYRPAIEAAFGCPIYERYASWEAGAVGHECPESRNLHVAAESVVVEIVRGDGSPARPGEMGHVLVTGLRNHAMPLVRYRLGDLAEAPAAESCSCGRGLPVLGRLLGRSNDLLVAADGRRIPPETISNVMRALTESVLQFQVVQGEDLTLAVKVVQRDDPSPETHRCRIAVALDELVGLPGATRVERVDGIPLTGAGKLRHVVSHATRDGEA